MIVSKLIFFCLAAVFLLGLWLVRRGLRGAVVDDHVYCGKCSFDLKGIAKDAPCPECGSPATEPRRIGRRAGRPRLIVVGVILVLVAPGLQSITLHAPGARGFGVLEPLWLLRREVRFGSWDAGSEIVQRISNGELRGEKLGDIVEEALDRRHSDNIEERIWWASIADAAETAGKLDAGQRQRYFKECVDVRWSGDLFLRFRPAVEIPSFTIDVVIELAEVEGVTATIAVSQTNVKARHSPNMRDGETWIGIAPPENSLGKVLVVRWRVRARNSYTNAPWAPDWIHTERIELGGHVAGNVLGSQGRTDGSAGPSKGDR